MIIISKLKKMGSLTSEECGILKALTPKDALYVLSLPEGSMGVATFQVLSALKCKLEFVNVPEVPPQAQLAADFFHYGRLSSAAKNNEEIVILVEGEEKLEGIDSESMGIKFVASLFELDKFKQTKKKAPRKPAPEKKEIKPAVPAEEKKEEKKEELFPMNEPVEKKEEDDMIPAAINDRPVYSDMESMKAFATALNDIPEAKKIKTFISQNMHAISEAVKNASDSEIGLQILLQTKLGRSDGDMVWGVIHKHFDVLRNTLKGE